MMLLRQCDTCTACCTTHRIPELNKPVDEQCKHVDDNKCNIYAKRPKSCRSFKCLWLQGHFDKEHRPDQLGLVFDVNDPPKGLPMALIARETRPGSSNEDAARAVLQELALRSVVIVVAGPERKLLGPAPLVNGYIRQALTYRRS